jgi:aerobic-type carbon monoxide dehydrogenase small subunit (CoxS/CutS family)
VIVRLVVNGRCHELDVSPDESLLHVLRERLGMRGTKEGCGAGECGACTVSISGHPRVACVTLAATVQGDVETVEGLTTHDSSLQNTFAVEGGFQCGFCTPGQLMTCHTIAHGSSPSQELDEAQLRERLSGNICRCTGYAGIVRALGRELSRDG